MKPEQWEQFKEAIAKDIQCQYPKVDYLLSTVYNAIERHKGLLEDAPPQEQVFKSATHEPVTVGGRVTWVEKQEPVVCEWVGQFGHYTSACGWAGYEIKPTTCPKCGLPVKVKGGGE